MSEKNKKFVNLDNARKEDQKKVLERIIKDGVCPFCSEHLSKYHKKPILKEGKYWLLTTNQWPYDNTKNHFLAILKEHKTRLTELSSESLTELMDFFRLAAEEYGIDHGGIGLRFGNTKDSGATVSHLHAHLIEPDRNRPSDKPVRFKIG